MKGNGRLGKIGKIGKGMEILAVAVLALIVVAGIATAVTAPAEEWNKTFGGSGYDTATSVQQTIDGGYIVAGSTESFGFGLFDGLLIKTDSLGSQLWSKTFGGTKEDIVSSVQQTSDGGYIFTGGTIDGMSVNFDAWLVKTDSSGNEQWNKTFGGVNYDWSCSVQQTSDGGYILSGSTHSFGAGNSDAWLIKTDSSGNQQWSKTFGGINNDEAYFVQQTTDGGYVLAGNTLSFGAGNSDAWLIKVASDAEILPGRITAISTNPSEPMLSRAKFNHRLAYVVNLDLYNPNNIAQSYQVGLKNHPVDENDLSKGYFTACVQTNNDPNSISVTIPAHGTSSLGFMCASEWDWIPEQKGFLENYMITTSQTVLEDLAEKIAGWTPLVNLVDFWIEFTDAADVLSKVQGTYTYHVELNSVSSPGIIFDSGANQNIAVGVPQIKRFLLGSSIFNKIASTGAAAISEFSFKKAPSAISVGIWIVGILADQFAWIQYQQAYDPDHNYTTVQEPIFVHFSELDAMPDGDAKEFALAYADAISLRNATFTAYVRYDGARIDNQSEFMLMQLQAANNFTLRGMQKMSEAKNHYRLLTASMAPLTDEEIQQIRAEIQVNGLPQEKIDILVKYGLGDSVENITQMILDTDPGIYKNPKNYTNTIDGQTEFLAYESTEYMGEIVQIKVEEQGAINTTASSADIAELENLKFQINLSLNQGIATLGLKTQIDEMISKSQVVLDETNNLTYRPYYDFAVNALAIYQTLETTLPATRYINGTVIDSVIRANIIGAKISIIGGNSTVSDSLGFYSFAVQEGEYNLTVNLDPVYYPNSSISVSTIGILRAEQNIELTKKPTGTISGSVKSQ